MGELFYPVTKRGFLWLRLDKEKLPRSAYSGGAGGLRGGAAGWTGLTTGGQSRLQERGGGKEKILMTGDGYFNKL